MRRITLLLLAILLLPALIQAKIVIIIHPSNTEAISPQDIRDIFLGNRANWKNGERIKIADNLDKATAETFYNRFIGKDLSFIKKNWIKKMLQGEMNPPETFKDYSELVDYIASQKKAIGFISIQGDKVPPGVKVLPLD